MLGPSLGWITGPAPVTVLPEAAARLGLAWLGIERDDLLEPLHGGTKPRKLDVLLAAPPFRDAPAFASAGAAGSGHLVALAAAAERLGRPLDVFCFGGPSSPHALENLAFVASRARSIHAFESRPALATLRPFVLRGGARVGSAVVVPPGATTPIALLGLVRAAVDLAARIEAGELPAPERIVVPLGTGGTAIGLAVGLGLAGVRATVHAIATVERPLSPERRLLALERALVAELARLGAGGFAPAPWVVDRSQLGRGYGRPSAASLAACEELAQDGLPMEPVYTGKAWAALAADERLKGRRVLFWLTCRRGPLPIDPRWRDRLPRSLSARVEDFEAPRPRLTRRRLITGGAALLVGGALIHRAIGYAPFAGEVMSDFEAEVLRAAAGPVLATAPLDTRLLESIAKNVDRFLRTLPPAAQREVHQMMVLIEHGTPLGGSIARFTRLDLERRGAFLQALIDRGGVLRTAAMGLRDLVLIGYYQDPSTWAALGYGGPLVPAVRRFSSYDDLRAPPGAAIPRAFQT